MNSEMQTRFEEVLKDEEYMKYVLSLGSAEAMSKELESKEIDLSPDEIRQIGNLIRKKVEGELSDEELEQVAGGSAGMAIGIASVVGWLIGSVVYAFTRC